VPGEGSGIATGVHRRVGSEEVLPLRVELDTREDPDLLVPFPEPTVSDPGIGCPQLLGDRRDGSGREGSDTSCSTTISAVLQIGNIV
jgi:hypothetical protein